MAASGEVTNEWNPMDGMRILVEVFGDQWGDYAPEGEVIGPPAPSSFSWGWLVIAALAAYVVTRKK